MLPAHKILANIDEYMVYSIQTWTIIPFCLYIQYTTLHDK